MPDTLLIDAIKQCKAAGGPPEESKVSAAQWDKVLALLAADPDGVKKKDKDGRLVLHYAAEMQAPPEVTPPLIHSVHTTWLSPKQFNWRRLFVTHNCYFRYDPSLDNSPANGNSSSCALPHRYVLCSFKGAELLVAI